MKKFTLMLGMLPKQIKKVSCLSAFLISFLGCSFYACADSDNYFNDTWNISLGSGVRQNQANTGNIAFEYNKPNNFLNFEARANLESALNFGTQNGDFKKSNFTFGLSEDFIFLFLNDFYSGIGFGVYMENKIDNLFDYQFTAAKKVFIGYEISNNFRMEGFIKHFSNNSLAENNSGLYVTGISLLFDIN